MSLPITATYAALLAFFYVAMSFYVIATRARTGINTGDGGNIALIVAMRRHGNMTEYVPYALLMMALAETGGLGAGWLHAAGFLLVGGRLIHPFGIAAEHGNFPARVAGTLASHAAILIPAIAILIVQLA